MDVQPRPVDVRFLLANERTLLAWVRTSLALLAAGGGIYEFTDISGRGTLSIALAVIGIATAAAGARRHARTARAIRDGAELPPTHGPELLALAVTLLGIALVVAIAAS